MTHALDEHKQSCSVIEASSPELEAYIEADDEPLLECDPTDTMQSISPNTKAKRKHSNGKPLLAPPTQNAHAHKMKHASQSSSLSKFNKVAGGICAVICIFLWVAMSEIIPLLQSDYSKPYFLRFCVGSTYTVMLPIWYCMNRRQCSVRITSGMIKSAFILGALYNLGAYFWYLSLEATITAINDTMYQFNVCVVYIGSVVLIADYHMTWMKNVSVVVCMLGVGLIGVGTRNQSDKTESNTWYGYVECFVSLIMYGLFAPLVSIYGKKYFTLNSHEHDDVDDAYAAHAAAHKYEKVKSKIFMEAMMGVLCLLTLWPGLLILHYTHIEPFELPTTAQDRWSIIVPSVMDTLYIAAFVVGINLTNPVFMAVAQLLVIPISFVYDVVFNELEVTLMAVFGSLLIFIGFLLMELPIFEWLRSWKTKRIQQQAQENKRRLSGSIN